MARYGGGGGKEKVRNGSIHFFPIGLGSSKIEPKLKSLPEIVQFLNQQQVNLNLKFTISF